MLLPVGAQSFIGTARAGAEIPEMLEWLSGCLGVGLQFNFIHKSVSNPRFVPSTSGR